MKTLYKKPKVTPEQARTQQLRDSRAIRGSCPLCFCKDDSTQGCDCPCHKVEEKASADRI